MSGGGTRAYIGITAQLQLPVVLPSTPTEQGAIAEALSDTDALIESLEQVIAKKQQVKQGAMQEMLTGKRRLAGFSGEWEEKRLDELGRFLKGSGVSKDESLSGLLPCVRYGELYMDFCKRRCKSDTARQGRHPFCRIGRDERRNR
jgi:type I restriction enzyme S subunit